MRHIVRIGKLETEVVLLQDVKVVKNLLQKLPSDRFFLRRKKKSKLAGLAEKVIEHCTTALSLLRDLGDLFTIANNIICA